MTENVPAKSGDWWKRPWVAVTVASALICITAVTAAITAYDAENRQQADRAADQYRAYAERVVACDDIESRAEHYACLAEAVQTEQQRIYAATNLRAQQDMSTWSFATLWLSFGLLIVTGVGVAYVAMTLGEAKAATRAAVKAAEAAENTVLETRRIGEAQVSAYLSCTASEAMVDANEIVSLKVTIVNHGQSPAYNVMSLGTVNSDDKFRMTFDDLYWQFIPPRESREIWVDFGVVRPNNKLDRAEKDKEFYVTVKTEWRDVFQNRHEIFTRLDFPNTWDAMSRREDNEPLIWKHSGLFNYLPVDD